MSSQIHIKKISRIPVISREQNEMRKKISCITIDYHDASTLFSSDIYIDAFISILVLSGTGTVVINYKSYPLHPDNLLLLSSSHLFSFKDCTFNFRCLCLFVSREFMEEMDSTDMICRRIKYGVKLYNTPVISLQLHFTTLLSKRIFTLSEAIDRTEHFCYKEVVLNSLFAFYLDLSDIIERGNVTLAESNQTRYESIIHAFIQLLVAHYRKEHSVSFYASQLNLSTHYLTSIVKRITGQSVSDFIFEMLYSDARALLTDSKLSIQEIATLLHFSDQSSFGKFFKRKACVSPADFRKKLNLSL